MSKYILIISTLIIFDFQAQLLSNSAINYLNDSEQVIEFKTQSYAGSSHLPMSFTKNLAFGGFIDDQMKEKAAQRLNHLNRSGFELSSSIAYYNFKPILFNNYGVYINAYSQRSFAVEYTDDFFRAVFNGNQDYKGEFINLQQSGFHNRLYHSIEGGIINKKFKLGISYTSIQKESNAQIYEGGISSSPSGTEQALILNGYYTNANTNSNIIQQGGWGAAINFEINNKLNKLDSNSNAKIVAGINGLGFQLLKNCSYSYLDTVFVYNGIAINELSDLSNPIIPIPNIDSLTELSSNFNPLPFELYVHKIGGKKTAKIHSCYGLRYRSLSNYSVLVYAGAEFHISAKFTIGSILSYGGYSKLNHGIHARLTSSKFIFSLNTNNMTGLFLRNSRGAGLNFSLCYTIK